MSVYPEREATLRVLLDSEFPDARLPTQGSVGSAGYDIYSCEDRMIPSKSRNMVATGIRIAFPPGHYARIASRSGLSIKAGIEVGAGVVDLNYRGVLGVTFFNHSDIDYKIKKGDRIAQLILEKIEGIPVDQVTSMEELGESDRGSNGFGSTG